MGLIAIRVTLAQMDALSRLATECGRLATSPLDFDETQWVEGVKRILPDVDVEGAVAHGDKLALMLFGEEP